MATVIHEFIGEMDCLGCGKVVAVKKAVKTGTLMAPCGWCDHKPYAVPGTIFHKNFIAKVRLSPTPPAANDDAGPGKPPAAAAAGATRAKAPWER